PLQCELRRCAVGQSTAAELRGSEFQRRTTVRTAWRGEPAGVCIAREHRRKHGVDRRNGRTCVATVLTRDSASLRSDVTEPAVHRTVVAGRFQYSFCL